MSNHLTSHWAEYRWWSISNRWVIFASTIWGQIERARILVSCWTNNYQTGFYCTNNKKGHGTRGNFSCNLQRNDIDSKTLQVVEGVSRSQSTCNAPAGNCFKLFLRRHLEISREQKMRSDWLIFTKIALKVAMDMSHAATCLATLRTVEDSSTFLITRNATFCCMVGCQNGVS